MADHDNADDALFRSDPLDPAQTGGVPLQATLTPIEQVTPTQAVAAAMALMPQRDPFTTTFVVIVAGILAVMFGATACRQVLIGVKLDAELLALFGTAFGFLTGVLATLSVRPKAKGGDA